ncbi:MAG: restriction endonuclease subunit S [Betaproteobacteria bacterium HGW-Betaproteobacteria-22]|nr:MAG: restriction endonuclease subunit S [Betaproteobacteria bacterium HGW-Betaproteobacteria-22]
MSEWQELTLGEITEPVKNTYLPKSDEQLAYIGLEHIEQETLRLTGIGKSSDVTSNKFKFEVNDVLFGKLRPYFRKVYKPKFSGICSTDIWVFRAKKGFVQDFLFYFLASWDFVDTANSGEGGTRMPRADWNFLKTTSWLVPCEDEQKAIASVLSSLDDKIDLLHRQNTTLERMAETLFRQWFVEEAREDWEECTLDDLISVKGGTTPSTKEPSFWNGNINWTSPRDLSNQQSVFMFDTERKITEKGLAQIGSGLLPVGTVLMSSRAPIGYLAISEIPVAINQGYIAIVCDKLVSNYFMYLWCKVNMEQIKNAGNGSTFEEISKSNFKALATLKPSKETISKFDVSAKSIFAKIKTNQKQIQTLEKLRDNLLPKLMSGEIRVEIEGASE